LSQVRDGSKVDVAVALAHIRFTLASRYSRLGSGSAYKP
jgi:hypothetical protein